MASRSLAESMAAGEIGAVQQQLMEYGSSAAEGEFEGAGLNDLGKAAATGQLDVVKWLLREKWTNIGDVGDHGVTALMAAAGHGRLAVVTWVLEEGGADVNEKNHEGGTALLYAAANGHLAVMKWLLQTGGARIDATGSNGDSALTSAAANGHLDVVQWLLEKGGARIDETGSNGDTALLRAAANGHLAVVQWLVQKGGARIDEIDSNGDNALMKAADKEHYDVVQWLLEGGASLSEELWFRLRFPTNCNLMFEDPELDRKMMQSLRKLNKYTPWEPLHVRDAVRLQGVPRLLEEHRILRGIMTWESLWDDSRWLQILESTDRELEAARMKEIEMDIWDSVDSTRRPSKLLLNMLLMGSPPPSVWCIGNQGRSRSARQYILERHWTGREAFLMNTCARGERIRARCPEWLAEKIVIVADSIVMFPEPVVVIVGQYSHPSVEEIWSAQLGMWQVTVDTTTTVNITVTTTTTSTTTSTTTGTSTNTTNVANTTTSTTFPTTTTPATTNASTTSPTATTHATTNATTTCAIATTTAAIPVTTTATTSTATVPSITAATTNVAITTAPNATATTTIVTTTVVAWPRRNPDRVGRKRRVNQ